MLHARRPRRVEPVVVAMSTDGDASLAHGVVIDAHLVARLGRIPLLRVEGTIVLGPAQVTHGPGTEGQYVRGVAEVAASDGVIGAELAGVAEALQRLRRA